MKKEITRNQYEILRSLDSSGSNSFVKSLTIAEILSIMERDFKENTLQMYLKQLVQKHLVDFGAKAGKANSYFINENGKKLLQKCNE